MNPAEQPKHPVNEVVQPVRCMTCGDKIPRPDDTNKEYPRCTKCRTIRMPTCGNMNSGHYEDDLSGASGSWDNAVKMTEDDFSSG